MAQISKFQILDPKRDSEIQTGRASWYPYYAGFSEKFAETLLSSARMELASLVGDPWNGSGTTTAAAARLGHDAFGYDLNPVMVLAARARMLSKREKNSLMPIGMTIIRSASDVSLTADPLHTWFLPVSAASLRGIERAIQRTLVFSDHIIDIVKGDHAHSISDLAAFFYVALFRTTRSLLQRFGGTNPTWIRKPTTPWARIRPTDAEMRKTFLLQVKAMTDAIDGDPSTKDSEVKISIGSSSSLPLPADSIDFLLSSPPYCTRIDYAVATQPELAILGFGLKTEFDSLRRQLIGTSTVPAVAPTVSLNWGKTCHDFLEKVASHKSKASATYYLKNHLQYYASLYQSITEISRTVKRRGTCVLVVQDSYYKDIHNDLPLIVKEMGEKCEMKLRRRDDFVHERTMARVNPEVRKYRTKVAATESVLCFSRN